MASDGRFLVYGTTLMKELHPVGDDLRKRWESIAWSSVLFVLL